LPGDEFPALGGLRPGVEEQQLEAARLATDLSPIAARPVISATSPKRRTLRSLQFTALYFVLPDLIDSSQLGLVSVLPEECV
jgi:hypothetical protein